MGKALSRVDIPAKVDGSAFYGLDYKTDDMLFAAIRLNLPMSKSQHEIAKD